MAEAAGGATSIGLSCGEPSYSSVYAIIRMEIRPALGIRLNRPFGRTRNLSRREKIDGIERGDDFTAGQQLLQIVAIAELFVPEDADPKIRGALPGFV